MVSKRKWLLLPIVVFTVVLVFGLMPGTVLGQPGRGRDNQPDITERGNALRSIATPVELTEDDVKIVQFGDFSYVAIDHNLGQDYSRFVWFEPTRLGGKTIIDEDQTGFNTLYLGVSADGQEVFHKGQVSIYYDLGDNGWKSIIVQFNGEGEFLSVNGISIE